MATEWIVEAKSGGTCVVRVMHSWFAATDEWDGQFESVENGWNDFFNILRLKLKHFPGQPCAAFDVTGMCSGTEAEVWASFADSLGLENPVDGQEVLSLEGLPAFVGTVAVAGAREGKQVLLLISEPGTGICQLFGMPMGEQIYLSIRFFLFGEKASEIATNVSPEWHRWFAERFPGEG